jgi:hypothetical protein
LAGVEGIEFVISLRRQKLFWILLVLGITMFLLVLSAVFVAAVALGPQQASDVNSFLSLLAMAGFTYVPVVVLWAAGSWILGERVLASRFVFAIFSAVAGAVGIALVLLTGWLNLMYLMFSPSLIDDQGYLGFSILGMGVYLIAALAMASLAYNIQWVPKG